MRQPLRLLALVTGLFFLVPGAHAEDLLAVYNLARANDPKFSAAQSVYMAERETLPQARADVMPTLSAPATRDRNNDETITTASSSAAPPRSMNIPVPSIR